MLLARLVTAIAAALFLSAPAFAAAAAIALPDDTASGGGPAPCQAPSMSVNPDVLTQGGTATITYSNPRLAGQTVVVDIDNGLQRGRQTATVEIVLDTNGSGSATWTVPAWDVAKFNAPDVSEVPCVVVRG